MACHPHTFSSVAYATRLTSRVQTRWWTLSFWRCCKPTNSPRSCCTSKRARLSFFDLWSRVQPGVGSDMGIVDPPLCHYVCAHGPGGRVSPGLCDLTFASPRRPFPRVLVAPAEGQARRSDHRCLIILGEVKVAVFVQSRSSAIHESAYLVL